MLRVIRHRHTGKPQRFDPLCGPRQLPQGPGKGEGDVDQHVFFRKGSYPTVDGGLLRPYASALVCTEAQDYGTGRSRPRECI